MHVLATSCILTLEEIIAESSFVQLSPIEKHGLRKERTYLPTKSKARKVRSSWQPLLQQSCFSPTLAVLRNPGNRPHTAQVGSEKNRGSDKGKLVFLQECTFRSLLCIRYRRSKWSLSNRFCDLRSIK
mmetsp:Transcript_496/g.3600  ORF Transcript_496/g.3600 Transcript_496/m.3600 type:complete len:128 (+) Transcript_496:3010-3393(+)